MAKARRIHWECPNGRHASVLGSTRPPLDATVRFCWSCSQESGRLVKRVAPALEAKRAAGVARAAAKRSSKAERERQAIIASMSVSVTDSDEPLRVDKLLAEVWALPTRRTEAPKATTPWLTVRRGQKSYTTGRCHYGGEIIVTIGRVDTAAVQAVVIHEAAHEIAYQAGKRRRTDGRGHGALFKSINRSLVAEFTGVAPPSGEGLNAYDFYLMTERHIRDVS